MKKLLIFLGIIFLSLQTNVFADEIIDSHGNITNCKIISVSSGLVEYKNGGIYKTFTREKDSNIFNDYVDVGMIVLNNDDTKRIIGKILTKDYMETTIKTSEGLYYIPWYKVIKIGIYNPQ